MECFSLHWNAPTMFNSMIVWITRGWNLKHGITYNETFIEHLLLKANIQNQDDFSGEFK